MDGLRKNNPDEAQKELKKALDAYPKYAPALFQMGRLYESRNRLKEASDSYRQAIAADDKYLYPYERLYLLISREEKWPEFRRKQIELLVAEGVNRAQAEKLYALFK